MSFFAIDIQSMFDQLTSSQLFCKSYLRKLTLYNKVPTDDSGAVAPSSWDNCSWHKVQRMLLFL